MLESFVGKLRTVWRFSVRPFYRLLLRSVRIEGSWDEYEGIEISPKSFGAGSVHPFEWYLTGPSSVSIGTVAEICRWLSHCTFVPDIDEFGIADHWQHPSEFEERRRGDCDDHSIWAWTKLIELGLHAKLFSGTWLPGHVGQEAHAWVVFTDSAGEEWLLESTFKDTKRIVQRADQVRTLYQPHFSVDEHCKVLCYGGFIRHLKAKRHIPEQV